VAQAVLGSSGKEGTTKKKSHKVVALALGCGERAVLHLP
jgi:hypothetical protein